MSKNISNIELFNYNSITTLKQNVINKQYLILDLWETLRDNDYRQIFLQLNNVRVLNRANDRILFDITGRNDIIQSMINIENKIISILKNYLARISKHGRFNFKSIIKDNIDNKTVLILNLNNSDYPINIYDNSKQKTNISIFNTNTTFNIILELMYIQLDMVNGMIMIDTRFRLALENTNLPTRIQITNVDSFLVDDKKDTHPKIVSNIENNFSNINTEVLQDSSDNDTKEIHQEHLEHDTNKDILEQLEQQKHDAKKDIQEHKNTNDSDIFSKSSDELLSDHLDNNVLDTLHNNTESEQLLNIINSDTSSEIDNIEQDIINTNNTDENIIKLSSDTDNNTDDIITSLKHRLN